MDTTGIPGTDYKYIVTSLDRLYNESDISNTSIAKFSQLEIIREWTDEYKLYDLDLVSTKIKFSLADEEIANLSLFNQNGEKILNLLNEKLNSGVFAMKVNLEMLKPGVYFYKLTTQSFSKMKSFTKDKR